VTRDQINWIASLSPDTEFFFRSPFGETVVVAVLASGGREEMGEDGMVMSWGKEGKALALALNGYGAVEGPERRPPIGPTDLTV